MDVKLLAEKLQLAYVCIPLMIVAFIVLYHYYSTLESKGSLHIQTTSGNIGVIVRLNKISVQRFSLSEFSALVHSLKQRLGVIEQQCDPSTFNHILEAVSVLELDEHVPMPASSLVLSHLDGSIEADSGVECARQMSGRVAFLRLYLERVERGVMVEAASRRGSTGINSFEDLYIDLSGIVNVVQHSSLHNFVRSN
jgi:hypothetical protein